MEKKQLKVSESEYAKNLGVAASTGAAIGGAAFAAAAYSTRAWETDSNEDNETLEIVEESSTDEMIQPETVSIEISDPVTADIAYTIDPLSPAESEAIWPVRRMMKLSSKTLNIQTKEISFNQICKTSWTG